MMKKIGFRVMEWGLLLVALVGLFSMPQEESAHWLAELMAVKAIGVGAMLALGWMNRPEDGNKAGKEDIGAEP